MSSLDLRLRGLQGNPALNRLQRGIERETLRITPSGSLAEQPHPKSFGSPLTHPAITTDFCEAQLELITGVHESAEDCLSELSDIHRFIHHELDDELLWPASMPCGLAGEEAIPIARYGTSNAAKFKEIYRTGLGHRYGRVMQTISGIHYNFSIPNAIWENLAKIDGTSASQEVRNQGYLRLIRNFRAHGWLLIYLFGNSPAVCNSFLKNKEHNLERLDSITFHLPFATSLRMGPLGYQSEIQSAHAIDYDSLSGFIESITPALTEPYPPYAALGIRDGDEYNQLTDALLQVEAEFYGTIRAKRKSPPGERAIVSLRKRGIEYVEVRCIDANPNESIGIDLETAKFLDVFLLHALLTPNEGESKEQAKRNLANQLKTVHRGRDPKLSLATPNGSRLLTDWAEEILDGCAAVAALVDATANASDCQMYVDRQYAKVADSSKTPSARTHEIMSRRRQPFASLGLELAFQHHREMLAEDLPAERTREFHELAQQSDRDRVSIESSDSGSFETYLADYLSMNDEA